jgi:hypothetical protein
MSQEVTKALSLAHLESEIKDKVAGFEQENIAFGRLSLKHAKEMGSLFLNAKEKVKQERKNWQPWVREICPNLNARTVGLYMQVAKNYEQLATTVANFETFTLKETQQLLNELSPRKTREKKPSKSNLLADVERAAIQYQQCLNQLFNTDLNLQTLETVTNMLHILNDTGDLHKEVRKKLEIHQLPSAANEIASGEIAYCPFCNGKLMIGIKSCEPCDWNMGETPAIFVSEDFSSFSAPSEFIDN